MKDNKSISPQNDFGHWHGYQEWYTNDGQLELRGVLKGGDYGCGYFETHNYDFIEQSTIYAIK
jgi:hypothetical protein